VAVPATDGGSGRPRTADPAAIPPPAPRAAALTAPGVEDAVIEQAALRPGETPDSADDPALRRLEQIRAEMRGYEREASRLRSLLRRALGLEPHPAPDEPDPEAVPGAVKDAAR